MNINRRTFIQAAVGALGVAVCPSTKGILPAPTPPLKSYNLSSIYLSKEALEDIRNWAVDQVDEETRREIYSNSDGCIKRMVSVNCHMS